MSLNDGPGLSRCVCHSKKVPFLIFCLIMASHQLLSEGFASCRIRHWKRGPRIVPFSRYFGYRPSNRYFATSRGNVVDHDITTTSCVRKIIDLVIPEGQCIGVELNAAEESDKDENETWLTVPSLSKENHWVRQYLHPDEVKYAMEMKSDSSRKSFLLGRIALRQSLETFRKHQQEQQQNLQIDGSDRRFDPQSAVLLKDEYGRPTMPPGFLGSISHKGNLAVGLVGSSIEMGTDKSPLRAIGVDLERSSHERRNIAKRILTPQERMDLGQVENLDPNEEVMLRFSVKEALYKAMHPLICQYVGFREAEAQPRDDGTFDVSLNLKSGEHERFGHVQAHWRRHGEFFLTSAKIELKRERPESCFI